MLGVLVVESRERGAFGAADFEILTAAAQQASIAIARVRLLEEQGLLLAEERRRADEREALLATITDLSSELELSRLLHAVLARAVTLLGSAGGELAIHDQARGDLVIAANYNMRESSIGTRLKLGEGAMGHVVQTGEQMIIPDYQAWMGRSSQYARIDARAVVVAPLLIGGRPVGAINVWHEDPAQDLCRGRPAAAQSLRPAGRHRPRERPAVHRGAAGAELLRGAGPATARWRSWRSTSRIGSSPATRPSSGSTCTPRPKWSGGTSTS